MNVIGTQYEGDIEYIVPAIKHVLTDFSYFVVERAFVEYLIKHPDELKQYQQGTRCHEYAMHKAEFHGTPMIFSVPIDRRRIPNGSGLFDNTTLIKAYQAVAKKCADPSFQEQFLEKAITGVTILNSNGTLSVCVQRAHDKVMPDAEQTPLLKP